MVVVVVCVSTNKWECVGVWGGGGGGVCEY